MKRSASTLAGLQQKTDASLPIRAAEKHWRQLRVSMKATRRLNAAALYTDCTDLFRAVIADKLPLPPGTLQQSLSKGTVDCIRQVAGLLLHHYFVPIFRRRRFHSQLKRLTQAKLMTTTMEDRWAVSLVKSSSYLFGLMAEQSLRQLYGVSTVIALPDQCVLVYAQSQLASTYFLSEGYVMYNKEIVRAPAIIDEGSSVASKKAPATIRSGKEQVLLFEVPSRVLTNITGGLAADVQRDISAAVLAQQRVEFRNRRVTDDELRGCEIFSQWPSEALNMLSLRFTPYVCHAGEVVCKAGQTADRIVYLLQGNYSYESSNVAVHAASLAQSVVATRSTLGSSEVPTPVFVGQLAVLFKGRWQQTIVANDNCRMFQLTVNDLRRLLNDSDLRRIAYESANKKRYAVLRNEIQNNPAFKQAISCIPLLSNLLSQRELAQLVTLFEPHVFIPGDLLCSRADQCEAIAIVVHGRAIVKSGTPAIVEPFEAIGYTLLVPQKWRFSVLAEDAVETIRLPRARLLRFLSSLDRGLVAKLKELTNQLVYPSKYTVTEAHSIIEEVKDLKTPQLFETDAAPTPGNTARTRPNILPQRPQRSKEVRLRKYNHLLGLNTAHSNVPTHASVASVVQEVKAKVAAMHKPRVKPEDGLLSVGRSRNKSGQLHARLRIACSKHKHLVEHLVSVAPPEMSSIYHPDTGSEEGSEGGGVHPRGPLHPAPPRRRSTTTSIISESNTTSVAADEEIGSVPQPNFVTSDYA